MAWLIEFAEVGACQAAGPVGRGLVRRCRVPSGEADPLRQRTGHAGGLRGMAIGLAASRSIASGQVAHVSELGFPLG